MSFIALCLWASNETRAYRQSVAAWSESCAVDTRNVSVLFEKEYAHFGPPDRLQNLISTPKFGAKHQSATILRFQL